MRLLEGKVCIITGGAGSLGFASASALPAGGSQGDARRHNGEELGRAAAALKEYGDSVGSAKADVSRNQETQRYIDQTVARWGKIDVLFSNAGLSGVTKPITEFPKRFSTLSWPSMSGALFLRANTGCPT